MPLVNPQRYDQLYQHVDLLGSRLLGPCNWTRNLVTLHGSISVDFAYQHGFIAMFFISFSAHSLLSDCRTIRRLVYGVCLIFLVGSLCYWIAPAEGPFIYRDGLNREAIPSQLRMHRCSFASKRPGRSRTAISHRLRQRCRVRSGPRGVFPLVRMAPCEVIAASLHPYNGLDLCGSGGFGMALPDRPSGWAARFPGLQRDAQ